MLSFMVRPLGLQAICHMKYICFLLIVLPVSAQQNLEDWKCGTATLVAGNPTTVRCNEPHNFLPGTRVTITGATGGKWPNIETQSLAAITLAVDATGTLLRVNDASTFPQAGTFTLQSDAEKMTASVHDAYSFNLTARGIAGTAAATHGSEALVYGPIDHAVSYPITITGPDTFTVPFNSSGYGNYTGPPVVLQRSSFTYTSSPAPLLYTSVADGVGASNLHVRANHTAEVHIPGCPETASFQDQNSAFDCARAFSDPGTRYGAFQNVIRLVVSGGIGTVTLTAPCCQGAPNAKMAPNKLVWLQSMNEGSNAFTAINRPWLISGASGNTVTIPNMGKHGVADGTYAPTGPGQKNLYLPNPDSLYLYFMGDIRNGSGYPKGYTQSLLKAGPPFQKEDNRLSFYVKFSRNMQRASGGNTTLQFGTYFAEQPSGAQYHAYHSINAAFYAGQWSKLEMTANTNHQVTGTTPMYLGNDFPFYGWTTQPSWTGEHTHYLDALYRWYINGPGMYVDYSNQTVTFGRFEMDHQPNQADGFILARSVTYNGQAYEIDFQGPDDGVAPITYELRHSTSDLMAKGFSTGLCKSGTATCSASDHVTSKPANPYMTYASAPMAAVQGPIYWAIRPVIPIAGTSGAGISPIWLITDYDTGMAAGDHITVSEVAGNTAANQSNTAIVATFPETRWFLHAPQPGPQTWNTPGQLVNIVSDGKTCTVNLNTPHNLQAGWRIRVEGLLNPTPLTAFRFTVKSIPSPTSFTYACDSKSGTYATDAPNYHMAVTAEPAVAIAGTGSGNWNGSPKGTLISTEDKKHFAQIVFAP